MSASNRVRRRHLPRRLSLFGLPTAITMSCDLPGDLGLRDHRCDPPGPPLQHHDRRPRDLRKSCHATCCFPATRVADPTAETNPPAKRGPWSPSRCSSSSWPPPRPRGFRRRAKTAVGRYPGRWPRIVVPTNQVLMPAGGRSSSSRPARRPRLRPTRRGNGPSSPQEPQGDLVFIDVNTGDVEQTPRVPGRLQRRRSARPRLRACLYHRRQRPPASRRSPRRGRRLRLGPRINRAEEHGRRRRWPHPADITSDRTGVWVTSTVRQHGPARRCRRGQGRTGGRSGRGTVHDPGHSPGPLLRHQLGGRPAEGGGTPGQ